MDSITVEEKVIVEELKRKTINDMSPKMLEDATLIYRFAKARDFKLVEAEAMLRKHMEWRKLIDLDTILTIYEPAEVLVKYIPTNLVCFDKGGSIVRYNDCGRIDLKGLWKVVTKAEIGKYVAYCFEQDRDLLIKKDRNLGQPLYTAIYDFEDLPYTLAVNFKALQLIAFLMKMFVDNFPETVKRLWVINAPFYFTCIFSVMKQVAPKTVIDKIRVHGKDGWKEELLELIDVTDLPAFLGGTKTDPDGNPLCETFIFRGQPVPKSYYKTREESKSSMLGTDSEKLTLKPFSSEEIIIEVIEENSILEWEFESKNKDINFSLLYKGNSEESFESVELIPKQIIKFNGEPENGYFKCEKTGKYMIVFHNSYSWIHSTDIFYRVEVKSPKNDYM